MATQKEFLIEAVAAMCSRVDGKGWTANHDGNITVRCDEVLLATPSAVSKGEMAPGLVLTLDGEGRKLEGAGKPFSELNLHLALYRARPEIGAVLHAHPPFAMARGMTGGPFRVEVPEAVISLGDVIPVVSRAMPGDPRQEEMIAEAAGTADVMMVAGNGVFAVGRDLGEAFLRMELLEHLLKIDYYARGMGEVMAIPEGDRRRLLEKRASLGLGPRRPVSVESPAEAVSTSVPAPADFSGAASAASGVSVEAIKSIIARELKQLLKTSRE